ncbi:MAG: VWA domain-containing protein, partial [Planctomycetales bacterium]
MSKFSKTLSPLFILALITMEAAGSQIQLDVSMSNPTLLAEKKQSTHLKVGLTGFELKSDRQRTPVNVSIVLDRSGSMAGEKIARAKQAAIAAIERLDEKDIVSLIAYQSTVEVIVPATRLSDKQAVISKIRSITAGGSTALFAGVSKGSDEIRKFIDKNRVNRIILLSDGLANVGPQSPSELGALGASLVKEGISVSTMGLGLDYNEDLMTLLASKSNCKHLFIEKAADLVALFNHEFDDVLSVVAQEVVIEVNVAAGVRPVKTLNIDSEITGQQVLVKMNQLYSKQEKYVLLELEVPASKAGQTRPVAEVTISYANMETKTTDKLSSTVSVNFSDSVAEIENNANTVVCTACVLQIASERNKLATQLRDEGDINGARQ